MILRPTANWAWGLSSRHQIRALHKADYYYWCRRKGGRHRREWGLRERWAINSSAESNWCAVRREPEGTCHGWIRRQCATAAHPFPAAKVNWPLPALRSRLILKQTDKLVNLSLRPACGQAAGGKRIFHQSLYRSSCPGKERSLWIMSGVFHGSLTARRKILQ